ncbi:hypothetical protein JCM1840_000960 [Sporobolomyces johnsonii]
MARTAPALALALCVVLAAPANAQYFNDPYTGSSYGVRIGIGVGIAVAVALIILVIGFAMRRRRARAFKTAYPLQPYQNGGGELAYAQGQPGPQGWGTPAGWQGQQQPAQPGGGAFDMPPPQYSNYRPDPNSHYAPPTSYAAPPTSPPPAEQQMQYAPPASPPPAATGSTPYYAPPPGPPPAAHLATSDKV